MSSFLKGLRRAIALASAEPPDERAVAIMFLEASAA